MILIFLGSWRSTLIIAVSIPLSIICSLLMLAALGETINIMTLGGLALAVGILVDDATVEIENINRNLEEGKEVEDAILTGAAQIAVPAFVSTLSICIVFVPMFFLGGVARYLFVPLAEAVVFAMLASYFLSRTIVPTMAKYLLKGHEHDRVDQAKSQPQSIHPLPDHLRALLREAAQLVLRRPRLLHGVPRRLPAGDRRVLGWIHRSPLSMAWAGLLPVGGRRPVQAPCAGAHRHAHRRYGPAMRSDRGRDPPARFRQAEMGTIIDNIGVPYSGLNLSYSNSATVGTADADILVTLAEKHRPTDEYTHNLRDKLTQQFPGTEFYYLPTDMVSQILNFGLPAQIDVQVVGNAIDQNHELAEHMMQQISHIPGTTDLRIQQPFNLPNWTINVDRTRAQQVGYSQHDVASDVLTSLSGSFQTSPTFYLNPQNHVSYNIAVQTPQYDVQNLQQLQNFPIATNGSGQQPQILGNIASIDARNGAGNCQPLQRAVGHRHLRFGRRHRPGERCRQDRPGREGQHRASCRVGREIFVRGQIQTMHTSFVGLVSGLLFSIILVYALIVVNFQSWLDPFIIIAALPGALAGIVWLLFLTGTHISVPALTGAIMCVGVATANSILVVSFAKEQMEAGLNCCRCSALRRFYALPPGHHDGAGDDDRHGADGFGIGRRRRAERAAGPCRYRRPVAGDLRHADLRSGFLLLHAPQRSSDRASHGRTFRLRLMQRITSSRNEFHERRANGAMETRR